ncbi:hypothetical protein [Streptomyces odonnellii]|uniref:hypothetical protein n=1 Tax=Streptomyces odonnellii TaxID=1417980 RepID=UPI0012FE84C9|nr:hypothetical protein [Streptomyces odonnellii]
MSTPGREQQQAAVAEFRARWRAVAARRPERRRTGRCQGNGIVTMATSQGPVTVPCLCCGGGASTV